MKTFSSCEDIYTVPDHQSSPRTTEPPHDKTNKMTFAPSKDSDQLGHPPSLIRVFTVRMKKHWVLSYPLSTAKTLSDWADAQADLSLYWAHRPWLSDWADAQADLSLYSFCWFCHEAAQFNSSTNLIWFHVRTFPVVKVILQVAVPDTELQLLQELLVVHQIKGIEYIKPHLE